MKIKWNIVDQILDITESTAQQLLDWLSDPEVMSWSYPCTSDEEYLGIYSFVEEDFDGGVYIEHWCEDKVEVYVPEIAEDVGIYEFWEKWRTYSRFRANMRRNFKRRYKL